MRLDQSDERHERYLAVDPKRQPRPFAEWMTKLLRAVSIRLISAHSAYQAGASWAGVGFSSLRLALFSSFDRTSTATPWSSAVSRARGAETVRVPSTAGNDAPPVRLRDSFRPILAMSIGYDRGRHETAPWSARASSRLSAQASRAERRSRSISLGSRRMRGAASGSRFVSSSARGSVSGLSRPLRISSSSTPPSRPPYVV